MNCDSRTYWSVFGKSRAEYISKSTSKRREGRTLNSRITACYVLGLITQHEHDDLHLIRKVRNDFAHDIHTTFKTESVVNRCRELHFSAKDAPGEKFPMEAAGQFHSAAVALIMNLTNRPHYVGRQRRKSETWPY